MKKNGMAVLTVWAVVCAMTMGLICTSCEKLDDWEGMNEGRAFYSYRAECRDFNYEEVAGPFDTAIRFSVGMDPIMGGDDSKVIEACNACYENLKAQHRGKGGIVRILKTRHPDGKQVTLISYDL